jgi:hypothetical protein
MKRFLSSSIVWAAALSAGAGCLAADPPAAPLRAAGEPPPPAAELPAFPVDPAPLPAETSPLCRNDKGQIACATDNRNGLFFDVRPGPAAVTFQLDVYLSECNLPRVPSKTRHTVSQESRRVVWYRFNQATPVSWTWRPIKPCWQVWFLDCSAGGQKRNCNDVLTVRGILAG